MITTAVEWLVEKFNNNNANFINWAEEYFEQAKEMEKQHIIDAANLDKRHYDNAEQYYNETFNK